MSQRIGPSISSSVTNWQLYLPYLHDHLIHHVGNTDNNVKNFFPSILEFFRRVHGLLSKPEGIIVGVVYLVEADPIKRMHDICRRQITSHQKDEGYSYGNFIRIGNHIATGGDLETNIEVLYIVYLFCFGYGYIDTCQLSIQISMYVLYQFVGKLHYSRTIALFLLVPNLRIKYLTYE